MSFNFQLFIEKLRSDEAKSDIVKKYEFLYGNILGDVHDQRWYKEYMINFATVPYYVKTELVNDFDWALLMQLALSSFSSESYLFKEEGREAWELQITVKSGDGEVIKIISELFDFQILRLYEIYIEEQMNLQILIAEEEKERDAILGQRHLRAERAKLMMDERGIQRAVTPSPKLQQQTNFDDGNNDRDEDSILRLFNFQAFISELESKEDKKEIIEKYTQHFGKIHGGIEQQKWYEEYVKNFEYIEYDVPNELKEEFDWVILQKLTAASFSSVCKLKLEDDKVSFYIEVMSGNQFVDKKIVELWSFQILRLFEIYIEEEMNLQILIKEEEQEKEAILEQRAIRLDEWRKHLIIIKSEIEMRNLLG